MFCSATATVSLLEERVNPMTPECELSLQDVYAAIDGVGLYLGPMFQTAKQLWRKEPEEGNESKVPSPKINTFPCLVLQSVHNCLVVWNIFYFPIYRE